MQAAAAEGNDERRSWRPTRGLNLKPVHVRVTEGFVGEETKSKKELSKEIKSNKF